MQNRWLGRDSYLTAVLGLVAREGGEDRITGVAATITPSVDRLLSCVRCALFQMLRDRSFRSIKPLPDLPERHAGDERLLDLGALWDGDRQCIECSSLEQRHSEENKGSDPAGIDRGGEQCDEESGGNEFRPTFRVPSVFSTESGVKRRTATVTKFLGSG